MRLNRILFIYRCIEIIGSIINTFLQDASEATGFSFTLMGGGLDKEGNIKMCMCVVALFSCFTVQLSMTGVLWEKPRLERCS